MTIHPVVSGRQLLLLMHERIIEHIKSHKVVCWMTFDEMATGFSKR